MFSLYYPQIKDETLPLAIAIAASQHSSNEEKIFCSGVPIQENIVLTAAHCITQFQMHWQNSALTIKTSQKAQNSLLVLETYLHPSYQKNAPANQQDFDAALLKLSGSFAPGHNGLALENFDAKNPMKRLLWMKGFSPIRLNAANAYQALTSPETWNKLKYAKDLPNEGKIRVKAELNQSAPCPGDSGAPVWQIDANRASLKGIVVQGNCQKGEANVLNLTSVSEWLTEQIQFINSTPITQKNLLKTFQPHLFASVHMRK